jgi:hypothetical protein
MSADQENLRILAVDYLVGEGETTSATLGILQHRWPHARAKEMCSVSVSYNTVLVFL